MKRAELFEAVWSRPMFHVARELGVGERALFAACKRAEVPTPPRGYWRQVSTGQTPARPVLDADGMEAVKLPDTTPVPAVANPHFTTRHWATTEPFRDAATLEHFVDGYRKAGLPKYAPA